MYMYYLYWVYNQKEGTKNFISENKYEINEIIRDENGVEFTIIDYAIESKRIIEEEPVYFW